ncbi:unnamed protein product [Thlaspi arvense]|uniref:F-box protein At3g26010-like beta-propeller domain-containing protein n=1 Tax=Thlaspi arvense TaxID=13288 RepID=A0AAU9SK12_THLAR|nr:unnamed protein product [Thlaspi arvense]
MTIRYYIGNPMLPPWFQLPPREPSHDGYIDSGLVTRMHNGALLAYKVVRIHSLAISRGYSQTWSFEIYSSDTGEWSVKQVLPGPDPSTNPVTRIKTPNTVSLNGKLHWLDHTGRIIVHDFFSHDDQVRAISLPAGTQDERNLPSEKMICTTSQGYFVLIDAEQLQDNKSYDVRIWRLRCDSWSWEKAREINMDSLGLGRRCVPVAINCFDIDIIYLWDLDGNCFVACNLGTLTKSYGARKIVTIIHAPFRNPLDTRRTIYSEDVRCFQFQRCSFVSHFVPSLQVVPT